MTTAELAQSEGDLSGNPGDEGAAAGLRGGQGGGAHEPIVDLLALFKGDLAAVRLPGFVPVETAVGWNDAVSSFRLAAYSVTKDDPSGPAWFHGANLYDTRPKPDGTTDYSAYFNNADADRQELTDTMKARSLPHPLDDVLVPLVAKQHPGVVELAVEPDGRRYFAGVFRDTRNGIHLHNDYQPAEAPELLVGKVLGALSALVYLETPRDGSGALQVFRRPTPIDEHWNCDPSYGYTPNAVQTARNTTIVPARGDVVIFDAWSMHRVAPSTPGTRRLTISVFFGLLKDGRIVYWS